LERSSLAAFGAFFDGILLHQILQWHHLLSLVQGDLYRDIRVQILADGLLHAAAYLLAAGGLVLLWRGGQVRPADRIVPGWTVLGFAAWQFADVILVHWAIGLHRVRVDVPNPLLWDVGCLVVLGSLPLIAGLGLLRGQSRDANRRSHRSSRMMMSIAIILTGALSRRRSHGGCLQERIRSSRNVRSGRHGRRARDLERPAWRHHDYRSADGSPRRSLRERSTPRNQRVMARLLRSRRICSRRSAWDG
jgi:uncharacterized membrane protein